MATEILISFVVKIVDLGSQPTSHSHDCFSHGVEFVAKLLFGQHKVVFNVLVGGNEMIEMFSIVENVLMSSFPKFNVLSGIIAGLEASNSRI